MCLDIVFRPTLDEVLGRDVASCFLLDSTLNDTSNAVGSVIQYREYYYLSSSVYISSIPHNE